MTQLTFFEPRLSPETVALARGIPGVCIFVNDACNAAVIADLAQHGTKIIATRSAGYNQIDLAAAKQHIPLVHARVWAMTGLLSTFWPGRGPCLACAGLETPDNHHPALLSPLPGIMGALQALEVLRLLGGLGPALLGRVLIFKGDQFNFTEKFIRSNPQCPVCAA